MKQFLEEAAEWIHSALESTEISRSQVFDLLERPQREEHGDIAFPCFQLAKILKKAPPLLAKEITERLDKAPHHHFEWVKNMGPYINLRLNAKAALLIVEEVFQKKQAFGHSQIGKGKKVLIEYSSPNVAKELHIGHFRNTVLGQTLNNIYKATGHETIALNHLGDWGAQFGKVAYGFLHYGDEKAMQANPLEYLTSLYVRVNQEEESNPSIEKEARLLFKKIEEHDPELTKLWERFCELSINGLKKVYARLGVSFDHYIGESFYMDKVPELIKELQNKKLLTLSDGAQVVPLEENEPPCLILTSDGTSLYATRDLAAAIWRKKHFQFDKCLYVVGSEQQLHFKQVFSVLQRMGYDWYQDLQHIAYGLYRFKDGKFSTRKGKVILAEEVLNEARDKVKAIIQEKNPDLARKDEVAEIVGVGAVIFNDLSTDRNKDVEFDWERVLDFEGDTGPYLQYSFARASSILRQGKEKSLLPKLPHNSEELLQSEAALSLMKLLGRFENSLEGALRLNKPSILTHYGIDLAKAFNSFYRHIRVLDNKADENTAQKLGLVWAFQQVLKNTLEMLCMRCPEEM